MSPSPTSPLQSTERISQVTTSVESHGRRYAASYSRYAYWLVSKHGPRETNSPDTASIRILDDDSLLHVFYFYRPFLLGEDQSEDTRPFGGEGEWVLGRWWYTLAHVCQRWRNVILRSASYLGLSLVCTKGTPVADMLAHSPPFPLLIDHYYDSHSISAEDEEATILALKQRDRVRRIRLNMPPTNLQNLLAAMDGEYPILEYLVIWNRMDEDWTTLTPPETLQLPSLRHLTLVGFALPIRSRILTTAVGLGTLCLFMYDPSTYFHPNTVLHWISSMPQLKMLVVLFLFAVPTCDVEMQLTAQAPITTPITLPNLEVFLFQGGSVYLEALVHRITTPRLEKICIYFFNQLTFSVPRFRQFMGTAENLRLRFARIAFSEERVIVDAFPNEEARWALEIKIDCLHLDWQVFAMAQISNSLVDMFSGVEYLILEHKAHSLSSDEHDEVDRSKWRSLFWSFSNVKTLHIDNGLAEQLSRCLELDDDGECPSKELLPELQELAYSGSGDHDTGGVFTSFVDARQKAGRPVTLARRELSSNHTTSPSPSPDPCTSAPSSSVTSASSEAGSSVLGT